MLLQYTPIFSSTKCPYDSTIASSICTCISAIFCHLASKYDHKSLAYYNNKFPPPIVCPVIKCLLTGMKWKWWFILATSHQSGTYETWKLFSENLRGTDPCAQSSSTCLWICHNCQLIYAASWTQLFPMSTVVKKRRDADSLKTDWRPPLVFIWGACHQCGDWRWMFCSRLVGRGLLSFVNLGPVGGATYHPSIFYSTISSFFTLLCAVSLILLSTEPIGRPLILFATLTYFITSSIPPSFSVLLSRAKQRLSWPHTSHSIGPIVYSLHPDTKDIKLTDQRAGARARLINEALGRREGGYWREDGWREAREEKGGRRPGQVGWQTHNQRTNRWELLLSSDKRAQPVQDTQADPHWQELLFPMLMSFMLL